jgi:hypothetical protein
MLKERRLIHVLPRLPFWGAVLVIAAMFFLLMILEAVINNTWMELIIAVLFVYIIFGLWERVRD